jgi:RNA polymerase sigma-70 factor (ECF subfamily)
MIAAVASEALAPASFEEIYRLYGTTIHRFCLSQLQDPHLAEDATSDVFAVALATHGRLGDEDGTLFWLLGIARRVVHGHRRGRLRRQRLGDRARSARQVQPDVHEQVATREEIRRVTDAMAHLGKRDRILVGLRAAAQLSYSEIGEFMNMSEGSARVATHRALKTLRVRLEAAR